MPEAPDDYVNIRGPRPWEDNTEYLEKLQELVDNNKKIKSLEKEMKATNIKHKASDAKYEE